MKQTLILSLCSFFLIFSGAVPPAQQAGLESLEVNAWRSLGPPGGNVIALALNPLNSDEIFAAAGGNQTKIYKSIAGVSGWTKISTIGADIDDLAVNPKNPDLMYALSNGIYKSTDRGINWSKISFPVKSGSYINTSYGKFGMNRVDGNTIYASGCLYESGSNFMAVIKSTDGGANWSVMKISPSGSSGYVRGLAAFPANPNIVYAVGYYYSSSNFYKAYKTIDGGNTWVDLNIPQNGGAPYSVAVDPFDSQKAYVGTVGTVWRTSDGGATWRANEGIVYANRLAIDPINTSIIFAGYKGICFKSTDGGAHFTPYQTGLIGTCNDLVIGPTGSSSAFVANTLGGILFGSTSGVFRSTSGGTTWADCSAGICGNAVTAIGIARSSPNRLFIECQNNGFFKTDDFGLTWQRCTSYGWCDGIKRILINPGDAGEIFILAGG